jgi:hypothetical protein
VPPLQPMLPAVYVAVRAVGSVMFPLTTVLQPFASDTV